MSSPYPVLYNRPIDQWKVTELKEELRKRKLITKGLKEDLVKRLDEAIRNERESVNEELGNGFGLDSESEVKSEDSKPEPIGSQVVEEAPGYVVNEGEKVDNVDVAADTVDIGGNNASAETAQEDQVQDGKSMDGTDKNSKVDETVIHTVSMENSVIDVQSVETKLESSAQVTKCNIQVENEDSKPPSFEDVKPNISDSNNQVSEVSPILGFQVKCESISTDSVSINEKNELKDNLNADNLNLELEVVKPEMVEPSSRDVPAIGGDLHSLGDQEPGENQGSMEEIHDTNAATADLIKKNESTDAGSPEKLNLDRSSGDDSLEEDAADLIKKNESTDAGSPEKLNLDTNAATADLIKKNESTDAGSPEKLNLDRSSGDDSLEEDVLDSKQIDSNHNSDEAIDRNEPMELPVVKEGSADVAMEVGPSPGKRVPDEKNDNLEISSEKRKLEDQELVGNSEPSKRQRRWNTETIKVPEPQTTNLTPSGTPKDAFQYTPRRAFTRSDSTLSGDSPKERIVPISQKTPTTSLRIDRFLRPFTLKAVQELLAKTGTVTDFWMDHIKTHCYVTYSSGEEAIATRKALYNLQWPPNGGRLLTADFVDPQEVKTRVEAPPQSPAPVSPSPTAPAPTSQPQPASHQHTLRQQLPPPPPLPAPPPPPPLSDPLPVRERLSLPPPPPKKPDPPIVTLDDLFRKTRATPRIYYLPLSEEQVSAKLTAQARSRKD